MTVLPDARLFEGHFDGSPILPGVAQIALALAACTERGLQTGPLTGLRDVRFIRPLGPNDAIDIDIDIVPASANEPDAVRFEIRTAGQPATTGLLLFASEADAPE